MKYLCGVWCVACVLEVRVIRDAGRKEIRIDVKEKNSKKKSAKMRRVQKQKNV